MAEHHAMERTWEAHTSAEFETQCGRPVHRVGESHDIEVPWILPGVAATAEKIIIPVSRKWACSTAKR